MQKILITGLFGFLGSYFKSRLSEQYKLVGLGQNEANEIQVDLSKDFKIEDDEIDFCIHAAGKAHIYPKSDVENKAFLDINVDGTKRLLKALNSEKIKGFVFISSVSVYGLTQGEMISETEPCLGNTPYAESKIKAEELVKTWSERHQIPYLILRLPLVVGIDAPGNLGDLIKAIKSGKYGRIAVGRAQKSLVHANDIAILIQNWLALTDRNSGIYNLTDGVNPSFFDIEETIRIAVKRRFILGIPNWVATFLAVIGDNFSFFPINTKRLNKITQSLTFDDTKARKELHWNPKPALQQKFVMI